MAPDGNVGKQFGSNIRQLRISRGLTQEALAEGSNLSVDAIRRVEKGSISPSLNTLSRLADGLSISLSTLFATFDGRRRNGVEELADFLNRRSAKEIRLASRLIIALFRN